MINQNKIAAIDAVGELQAEELSDGMPAQLASGEVTDAEASVICSRLGIGTTAANRARISELVGDMLQARIATSTKPIAQAQPLQNIVPLTGQSDFLREDNSDRRFWPITKP